MVLVSVPELELIVNETPALTVYDSVPGVPPMVLTDSMITHVDVARVVDDVNVPPTSVAVPIFVGDFGSSTPPNL